MKHFLKYQVPFLLWVLFIFALSSIPSQYFLKTGFFRLDKPIHVFIFFTLGWLGRRAFVHQSRYPRLREHNVVSSFLFAVVYGVLDEIHQAFIPGREPELFDLIADVIGGVLFLSVFWWRDHIRERGEGTQKTT